MPRWEAEVPGDNHAISSTGIEDTLRTGLAGEERGGIERERHYRESMFWVREGMGARVVRDGDRFERDEQRKCGPQASDAKRWELQSRN